MYLFCTRKLGGTIDVIGGQAGTIRRVEGRRRDKHASEENPIQVNGLDLSSQTFDVACASMNSQQLPVPKVLDLVHQCGMKDVYNITDSQSKHSVIIWSFPWGVGPSPREMGLNLAWLLSQAGICVREDVCFRVVPCILAWCHLPQSEG